ncbi:hypothetical protein FLAG1_02335 [Fusarium langsethiae]|uniref:Uncharacterized protein n=1 Tax=Fusarium langsethiae TaxID=179993 RepID=A0A0N0V7Y7_FUSLA|nr:hypothetical protein FLAG1_02335 [Fusarium langsethiae]GKU00673.1 unnamed protein product [Fusarium langsethiae]GKU14794.1 unnamed protein product [Fusarium langsethiae]
MASSNPFRKSAAFTVDTATFPNSTSSAAARFPALDSFETASTPPPPTSFQQADTSAIDHNSKVTKKVRVLSPPPLSPDPPEWSYTSPSLAQYAVNPQSENDPFDATSTDDSDLEMVAAAARSQALTGGQGAGNPFSKTIRDLDSPVAEQKLEQERKEEGHALKVANRAKQSLDVNSFKRLLMTGNSESDMALAQSEKDTKDKPSVFRRKSHEAPSDAPYLSNEAQEASLISQDASDIPEDEVGQESVSDSSASARVNSKSSKKPPPPPSSRHGKSIKLNLVGNQTPPEALATLSPSEINKPLPPAPIRRSSDEEGESPFDREAAGKAPGTGADIGATSPGPLGGERKAVPAPPPRRGHARAESKANASQQPLQNDENLSRSSSMRSRSEHKRQNSQAGAPPPPPRRSHASKHSTQLPTGMNSSFADLRQSSSSPAPSLDVELSTTSTPLQLRQASTLDLASPRDGQHPTPKSSAPPPPPPARNTSVRRPASIRSVDSSSRRVSFEAKPYNQMAPPPPPRRQRGSSKGSIDGPRRTSLDSVGRAGSSQVPEEESDAVPDMIGSGHTSPISTNEPGKSFDILADLDALQREVDALRGKLR